MSTDPSIPAARYLRMSIEHQQYSLLNQAAAIERSAETHGFTVVRTNSDAGASSRKETNDPVTSVLFPDGSFP